VERIHPEVMQNILLNVERQGIFIGFTVMRIIVNLKERRKNNMEKTKERVKELRRHIKDITFQRSDLLRVQRGYRRELNDLIEESKKHGKRI
jgi:uncharacterized membrane-anchored protein YhcB (DUF1043 family)